MISSIAVLVAAATLITGQTPAAVSAGQEITLARGRLFAPAWVNGVGPYPFLIDTAAPYVALDAPIAGALGLPDAGKPEEADGFSAHRIRIQALEVAGRPALECSAYATDLAPMEALYGLRVAGILGLPGLPERFLLDCEGGRLARYPLQMGPEWIAVPISTGSDGVMRVPVTVNGEHAVEAELDTVFSGTLALPRNLLEQWDLFTEHTPRLEVADGAGSRGAIQIRLPKCTVGPLEVETPLCEVLENGAAPQLGMRFWSRFMPALDRAAGTLHVLPLVPLPWHDPPVHSAGVTPAGQRGGLWRLFIAEGSPAQRAGLLTGDLLVSINGMDMAEQSFDYVHRALTGQPATALEIAVFGAVRFSLFW
jgi:predicted aspartyl protease